MKQHKKKLNVIKATVVGVILVCIFTPGVSKYSNVCVGEGNPPPTLEDLGVLPSVMCRTDGDCGGGLIFRCDKQAGSAEGQCVQWAKCTENTQCVEALGEQSARCAANGGCQIYDANDPSQPEIDEASRDGEETTVGCREGQDCVSLANPLSSVDIPKIIGNAVQAVMGIVGTITLGIFLYAGFLWLTSAGNSEKIQKGLQGMLWAGIGIIVIFSSYAILTLILKTLQATP